MAFGISFEPTFKHTPWVDAVDRVAAGGDNGFNIRFQRLEADLGMVGRRFTDVSAALDALAATAEVVRSVNIAPVLSAVGPAGWDISTAGEASKPPESDEAQGAVPVTLPASGAITGFRAFGRCSGTGKLKVDLVRRKLTGGAETKIVQIVAQPDQAFPPEKAPAPADAVIDAGASYFIVAHTDGAAKEDTMVLTGFQVTYKETR
ncbi:hypothetical protein [Streptomyces sp. NRRL S-337]|uniref:hypothetical protein n=1 Tax=Streptomyces sp. NRRL S-337 TaxID=1463900 RepID=UPI0004C4E962|nr:hypothetical protein [Streptomyces sp. NRRL S-337]